MNSYADYHKITELAVKQVGRWAVYVSNGLELITPDEIATWDFVLSEVRRIYCEIPTMMGNLVNGGLFFFDTESEMDTFYRIFDAPLTDSSAIYACTYAPTGECLTENT